MKALIAKCRFNICVNSITSAVLSMGVRPIAYVDDAVPVASGEAIMYVDDGDLPKLNIGALATMLSYSSALFLAKALTGIRAFARLSSLKGFEKYAFNIAASGSGGILDDVDGIKGEYPIPIIRGGDVHIVEFNGIGTLSELNSLYAGGFRGRILLSVNAGDLVSHRRLIRSIRMQVAGLVIKDPESLAQLQVADAQSVSIVSRCRNCLIDYIGGGKLAKCPRCGGRLVKVTKANEPKPSEPRVILIRSGRELTYIRRLSLLIMPEEWFTK